MKKMKKYYRTQVKGHFLLLEVLISFVLVVMCILPMISTHVVILKSQYEFIKTVELDHAVNLMHGELVQRLYQNRIPWSDIQSQKQFSTDELLQSINYSKDFPFKGNYYFKIEKSKPPAPASRTLNLVELIFDFIPKGAKADEKPLEYKYKLYIVRTLKET